MRRFGALLLMALMLYPAHARAEPGTSGQPEAATVEQVLDSVDLRGLQQLADEAQAPVDVRGLMLQLAKGEQPFDGQRLLNALGESFLTQLKLRQGLIMLLVGPALLWALLKQFHQGLKSQSVTEVAGYVCYLAAASVLLYSFAAQVSQSRQAVDQVGRLTENTFPVLIALLSATGGTAAAGILQPAAAVAGGAIAGVVHNAAFVLTSCAALLAVLGNLSERVQLSGLFKLTQSLGNWMMGILMTAFLGVMTVQGLLGSVYDGVSIRTARYAVDNLLPIVGGEVADTLDILVTSALLVKNAAGITGLVLLVSVCLMPMLSAVALILALRLSAAILEPVADGPIVRLIGQFASVMSMMLVAMVCSAVLFIVLVGAVLSSGNAIAMLR